ncbi:MAG: hypothetical protein EOP39_04400 [Rubrivivax sp.]|nr:MAG: hypothetical protein EOP39_04400 [Rubrivivax sp.]
MDLKAFVQNSITSILEGVKDAQAAYPNEVNPDLSMGHGHKLPTSTSGRRVSEIDFDVAVTVSTEGTTQADGRIEVLNIVKLGGSGSAKDATQSISRLKFVVPVTLPGGST